VRGETLTFVGLSKRSDEGAEPIPGPSTESFGRLAWQHNLCIDPGLLERDCRLVYNVAVLFGPDGRVVGKYRKVCLPRGEIEGGHHAGLGLPHPPDPLRHRRDEGLLRRLLPGGRAGAGQPRRRGHRLAGLGLQPAAGPRLGVREPRLHRQQHG
jgi:hypothetical protein